MEYTSRVGGLAFAHIHPTYGAVNQFIWNLKKKPTSSQAELEYKRLAISKAATIITPFLEQIIPACSAPVMIPIPGSKSRNDPDYDPRMLNVLQQVDSKKVRLTIWDIVQQTKSTQAFHTLPERPSPDEQETEYSLVDTGAQAPTEIFIIDDVITTGCHYVAVKNILARRYPNAKIYGLFLARTVPAM
jgi:predicted amidophosphoribosyltransferase